MNYNQLVTQIRNITRRDEDPIFVAAIPSFIERGLLRIYTQAKTLGTEQTATENAAPFNLRANQPYVSLRPFWKQTMSLAYKSGGKYIPLEERTYEYCTSYWPYSGATTGTPKFYAITSGEGNAQNQPQASRLFISPTPDQDYDLVHLFLSLPLFGPANQTNYYADNYPSAVFHSCCIEAWEWLNDKERMDAAKVLYDQDAAMIKADTVDRYEDRRTKRDKD